LNIHGVMIFPDGFCMLSTIWRVSIDVSSSDI
jgi:hypothetical protein